MAHSPPPSQSSTLLLFLLLATTVSAATFGGVSSTTTLQELETVLDALRIHGHTLFTNAITTSDLQYQLLTPTGAASASDQANSTFTLFAPIDAQLFALDMASDAAAYISTLRYHVIPNHRYTFADLQSLSSPFLDTLLPHYSVLIGRTENGGGLFNNVSTVGVMVDGVRVSNPDLFLGSRFAVHGIDGILVTGLNMNHDLDSNENETGRFPPAESPAVFSGSDGNIPAEGPHASMPQFDWKNAPIVSPLSPFYYGNIPVAAPPEISPAQPEKTNSLRKKKRGKRHRRGQGHRRNRVLGGHIRDDL